MELDRVVLTSPRTDAYNCVAWALGVDDVWWWPDFMSLAYWPDGVPREETVEAFILAFQVVGFRAAAVEAISADSACERIAIFSLDGTKPTHVARRVHGDLWASKLGRAEDVEHSLQDLVGDKYGRVCVFLDRRASSS